MNIDIELLGEEHRATHVLELQHALADLAEAAVALHDAMAAAPRGDRPRFNAAAVALLSARPLNLQSMCRAVVAIRAAVARRATELSAEPCARYEEPEALAPDAHCAARAASAAGHLRLLPRV